MTQDRNNGHNGNNGNGKNGEKVIQWRGMSDILRPMEGGKGADALIQTVKPHKDWNITTRSVLNDDIEVIRAYRTISKLSKYGHTERINRVMFLLELKLSKKGIGINSFIQCFTGIYSEQGLNGVKRNKFFGKKKKEQEANND